MSNIGFCGLACKECTAFLKNQCIGCKQKKEKCDIKLCVKQRNVSNCSSCNDFPCKKEIFTNIRVVAFNKFINDFGEDTFVKCLRNNKKNGIYYHRNDGTSGDYDLCQTEKEVINLLKEGMMDM